MTINTHVTFSGCTMEQRALRAEVRTVREEEMKITLESLTMAVIKIRSWWTPGERGGASSKRGM